MNVHFTKAIRNLAAGIKIHRNVGLKTLTVGLKVSEVGVCSKVLTGVAKKGLRPDGKVHGLYLVGIS